MVYLLEKNIDNTRSRPAIFVKVQDNNIKCLIDTGADTPVWTLGSDLLIKAFPDAELKKDLFFELGGFGKGKEKIPVYNIPVFTIKSDYSDDYIQFNNLLVACCIRNNIYYPLILSATMLSHTNYEIINFGKCAPLLRLRYEKREYEIRPVIKPGKTNTIDRIYSFTQSN